METKMLQIKVKADNVIATSATKWLVALMERETDFFLDFLNTVKLIEDEKSNNPVVPFLSGVHVKMEKGEEILGNEIISFSWLVRDAYEHALKKKGERLSGEWTAQVIYKSE